MLPCRLQRTESPAEALPGEAPRILRRFRVRNRVLLIADDIAEPAYRERQVGILRQGVMPEPAQVHDELLPPCAHRPGDHGNGVQIIQRAPVQIEPVNVFDRLKARDPFPPVSYTGVPAYGAHSRLREM